MTKAKDTDIPIWFLRECFILDPETGALTWLTRPREHFASAGAWATWNKRFTGKPAGAPNDKGYLKVQLTFDGHERCLGAHRIVFALANGRWPTEQIDHANGVKAGDGIGNLREASNAENQQNIALPSTNRSGFKGVHWHKRHGKWAANITVGGRQVSLGHFDTFEHACQARIGAESVLHPFRHKPKPLDPAKIIPDGALVTGVYSFTGNPKRVTYTYVETRP
jgi:HNH endonuclease/AP2 domain